MASTNGKGANGNGAFDVRHMSRNMLDGVERAGARAMLKGIGLTDDDLKKPMILIANTWIETMPCNLGLRTLAHAVKEGIRAAGGVPMEMNTIAISDGVTMGTEGMKTSLISREMIADSVELVGARSHVRRDHRPRRLRQDAARAFRWRWLALNIPGFLLYGGTILPGEVRSTAREATVRSVYEAIGALQGRQDQRRGAKLIEDHACPTHGACGGQYTANTMAMAMEFIGLSPLGIGIPPAVSDEQWRQAIGTKRRCRQSAQDGDRPPGRRADHGHAASKGITPRDILTREAFENAIAGVAATGGSTNAVLHLLALAREAGSRALDRRFRRDLPPHAADLRHDAGRPLRRRRSRQSRRHAAGRQAHDRGRLAAWRSDHRQRRDASRPKPPARSRRRVRMWSARSTTRSRSPAD